MDPELGVVEMYQVFWSKGGVKPGPIIAMAAPMTETAPEPVALK